jgi:hypothetical protein
MSIIVYIIFSPRRPGALFEKTAPGPRKNFLYTDSHCTTLLNILSHWDHLYSVSKEDFVICNFGFGICL